MHSKVASLLFEKASLHSKEASLHSKEALSAIASQF